MRPGGFLPSTVIPVIQTASIGSMSRHLHTSRGCTVPVYKPDGGRVSGNSTLLFLSLQLSNMKLSTLVTQLTLSSLAAAAAITGKRFGPYKAISDVETRDALQNVVTWDAHSVFIRGERVMIYSGEFHPFRLPVPSLWLDVFQKVKALGFNTVSFSVDWALLEAKEGEYRAKGIFDLNPFFRAADTAGVFLIARPGPYINAEVAGGGFPGRLQRLAGQLRTKSPDFLNATEK